MKNIEYLINKKGSKTVDVRMFIFRKKEKIMWDMSVYEADDSLFNEGFVFPSDMVNNINVYRKGEKEPTNWICMNRYIKDIDSEMTGIKGTINHFDDHFKFKTNLGFRNVTEKDYEYFNCIIIAFRDEDDVDCFVWRPFYYKILQPELMNIEKTLDVEILMPFVGIGFTIDLATFTIPDWVGQDPKVFKPFDIDLTDPNKRMDDELIKILEREAKRI